MDKRTVNTLKRKVEQIDPEKLQQWQQRIDGGMAEVSRVMSQFKPDEPDPSTDEQEWTEWSEWMQKAEIGKLLRCPYENKTRWVDDLVDKGAILVEQVPNRRLYRVKIRIKSV